MNHATNKKSCVMPTVSNGHTFASIIHRWHEQHKNKEHDTTTNLCTHNDSLFGKNRNPHFTAFRRLAVVVGAVSSN